MNRSIPIEFNDKDAPDETDAENASQDSASDIADLLELNPDDAELLDAYSIELVEDDDDDDVDAANVQSSSIASGAGQSATVASSTPESEASKSADAAAGPLIAELVATRSEMRRLEAELEKAGLARDEAKTHVARRQADFDNYRKRVERDRGETYQQIVTDVVGRLLPVIDNMHRALEAERLLQAGESKEFLDFLQGIELIYKQLNGVLEKYGVEAIASVGEQFDPRVHEAVASVQSDEHEADTVVEELARGYRLGEKLLRPAMVKVATR